MKRFILALLLLSAPAHADEATNVAFHIMASSIITTSIYAGLSRFTGGEQHNKLPALIGATAFSIALGTAYEVMDANGKPLDGLDMATNIGASLLTAGIIYVLDIHGVKPARNGVAIDF